MTWNPVVALRIGAAGTGVIYRPTSLAALLTGQPVDRALALLPRLLPICATAQQLAATRALEAALGIEPEAAESAERERRLWREQLLASAWRLLIDWPRWLGEAPKFEAFRALRAQPAAAVAEFLRRDLPDAPAGAALEELPCRLDREEAVASRLLLASCAQYSPSLPEPTLLAGEALRRRAAARLMPVETALRDSASPVAEGESPVVVGALAMQRHGRGAELAARTDLSLLTRLLLAQWLDMRALADRGPMEDASATQLRDGLAPGSGIGSAPTARGPLYHYLEIDKAQRVRCWRYVAPTDWHCGSGGVLSTLAAPLREPGSLHLALAAVDPCATWQLQDSAGQALEEAA